MVGQVQIYTVDFNDLASVVFRRNLCIVILADAGIHPKQDGFTPSRE